MRFKIPKVSGYRADVINKLIDAVNSLVPMDSPDIAADVKSTGTAYRILTRNTSNSPASTLNPWQIIVSPDAEGTAAWRTVRVHSGTINAVHPKGDGSFNYSDDTDVDENGDAQNCDIELDASKTTWIVLVQSRGTEFEIDETHIITSTDTAPFVGYPETDIFRNVTYRVIGKVTTTADTGNNAKQLTIDQTLTDNLATNYTAPLAWEPCVMASDIDAPAANDWKKVTLCVAGYLSPEIVITDVDETFTLTTGETNYLYLKVTLNTTTGYMTSAQLACGVSVPQADTPDAGFAPSFCCRPLASLIVPSETGKIFIQCENIGAEIGYSTTVIGYDVNTSGALINLLAGYFSP